MEDPLEDFNFTVDDLISAIGEIGTHSSAGPDRFPAILLKNCRTTLVSSVHHSVSSMLGANSDRSLKG